MALLKNLADVSREEQVKFIESFDHFLADMDGVIWVTYNPLPGAIECMENLKKLGKKVRYATNNPLISAETIWKRLHGTGFGAQLDDLTSPVLAIVSYLKHVNFNRKAFVLGTKELKEEIRKAQFDVAEDPPQEIEETITTILKHIQDDESIGAVIMGWDVNLTFIKLQKMLTFLRRKDCLFLVLAGDREAPIGPLGPLIANQHILQLVKDFTGREAVLVGKPSQYYVDFVNEKFGITDPKRAVFVGDQINQDMKLANIGGYQKLLVLTGIAGKEDINNWQYPEEYKPEYYVESLNVFNNILKSLENPN
uniref:Phosphoglycolate phosphatase 2 n=1 Tax=Colaphellus bowringi TaxID=561076 RepID=A0A8G0QFU4_9CUCU|nr:phosphoglycolate phosphatase 2 [Colaphellus bowringi]